MNLSARLSRVLSSRGVGLTTLTVDQLREFLITLVHASESSLDNPSWTHKTGSRSLMAISSHGELDEYEGHWILDANTGEEGSLDEHEDVFWLFGEDQCYWIRLPLQSGKSKGGLSKGGLDPKGANWAKKGPFAAISALPPWLWGAEELVPIGPR